MIDFCVFTGHRGVELVGSSLTLVLCLTNATPRQGLDDKFTTIIMAMPMKKKTLDKRQPLPPRLTHGETLSRHTKAGARFHTGREPPYHKVLGICVV